MNMNKCFASCILVAAIAGCTQKLTDPQQPDSYKTPVDVPMGEYELDASIGLLTKTALNDLTLSWESDDVIKVWTGETFTDYVHQGEGKFKGEKPAALKGDKYLALYPTASVSGTKATFSLPQEQAFAARKANDLPMVAVWGEDESCVFKPVCSILEMPLTVSEGITLLSIAYTFNGNVGAGEYTYDWTTGEYSSMAPGNINITGTLASGNIYNPVVPGDYSEGFTLTLADNQNCAMILTASGGKALAAGKVQPLGAVAYEQLAPRFTISYEDWAATATLDSTPGEGTKYWLSKTVNGEPLTGVAPVDMSKLTAGAKVKLYGYLCSENVSTAGVKDGDEIYLVTEYVNGSKKYLRSVEYTYHPDPLEVILYDDALSSNKAYSPQLKGASGMLNTNYTDDKAFGTACMRGDLSGSWAQMRFDLWDNTANNKANFQAQAKALYNFEFYVKADKQIKGNTYFAIRYLLGSAYTGAPIMSKSQSAWQNFTIQPKGTPIPANTWMKVSIPMNQIWLSTKITTDNYPGVDINEYQGYTDNGGRDGWLYSYKEIDRIYINVRPRQYPADYDPTIFLIDHFTIRKSTL